MISEIGSCLTTIRAAVYLNGADCGATTRIVAGKLASISMARLICFLSVQSLRLVIAAVLCYGGSKFIANTIALGDLIINCVALEVGPPGLSRLRCSKAIRPIALRLWSADLQFVLFF